MALRKAVVKIVRGEETIKAKEAEFKRTKKELLEKSKGVVTERNQHFRECKQAMRKAASLESDLEAARATIQLLENEKVEEAERSKKEMDRLRQSRYHEVMCKRNRVATGMALQCNRQFKKIRKYMTDKDKQESKLFLHRQRSGLCSRWIF